MRRHDRGVVVYTGTTKLDTRLDQVGTKGYAVGFQGLVRFVMAQLPQNEIIKDALRAEVQARARGPNPRACGKRVNPSGSGDERSVCDD